MANFLMALKLGAERSPEIPLASASKSLHCPPGARWQRQIDPAFGDVPLTVPKRLPVRIVQFDFATSLLAPVRFWGSSLCDVCRCHVGMVFCSGTAKLGLCCYTQHLVRDCRDG